MSGSYLFHLHLVTVNVKTTKVFKQVMLFSVLSFPLFSSFHFFFCDFIFLLHPQPQYLKNCIKRITRKRKILRFHNKADVATRCHYNKSLEDLISFCLPSFDENVIPTVCFFCILNFPELWNHSGLLFVL